jgi:Ca2+-binding RTX toxin-like protein
LGSDLLSSIENVITGTLADNITGSTAANDLNASDGNDTLSGGDGNDTLRGGNGNDSMLGGNGNDSMIGGSGADTLAGNAGNDVFVFNGTADFGDRITDFSAVSGNDDGFAFSGLGSGLTAGVLAATRFRTATTNAAGDSDDRFIFRTTDKTLWFDADGTGAGGPLLVATLTIGSVTAADILIL